MGRRDDRGRTVYTTRWGEMFKGCASFDRSMSSGAAKGVQGVAGQVGSKGGVKIVKAIPMSQIHAVNRALGGRIVVKWGAKQGAVRLGRLVPFGIGAGIGAGGNVLLVNGVGKAAKNFFDDGGEALAAAATPSPSTVGALAA